MPNEYIFSRNYLNGIQTDDVYCYDSTLIDGKWQNDNFGGDGFLSLADVPDDAVWYYEHKWRWSIMKWTGIEHHVEPNAIQSASVRFYVGTTEIRSHTDGIPPGTKVTVLTYVPISAADVIFRDSDGNIISMTVVSSAYELDSPEHAHDTHYAIEGNILYFGLPTTEYRTVEYTYVHTFGGGKPLGTIKFDIYDAYIPEDQGPWVEGTGTFETPGSNGITWNTKGGVKDLCGSYTKDFGYEYPDQPVEVKIPFNETGIEKIKEHIELPPSNLGFVIKISTIDWEGGLSWYFYVFSSDTTANIEYMPALIINTESETGGYGKTIEVREIKQKSPYSMSPRSGFRAPMSSEQWTDYWDFFAQDISNMIGVEDEDGKLVKTGEGLDTKGMIITTNMLIMGDVIDKCLDKDGNISYDPVVHPSGALLDEVSDLSDIGDRINTIL